MNLDMRVIMTDPRKENYFYEESIKTLRTNIQFTGKNVKIILLTSCYPNEGKSDIAVPLNEYAQKILEKICGNKKFPKSGPVFLYRGKPMKEVRKTMKTVCEICGIKDLHVHDLRRSLGSWMLMNGVDIAVVSRTLGHKSIAVTEKVYAHLLPEKISNATRLAVEAMRTGKV